MCAYYVKMMCAGRIGLDWAHDVFTFIRHMFMHFSCIRTIFYLIDIKCVGTFLSVCLFVCLSVCLSLSLALVALWHLNKNPLCLETLFIPRHLLLLLLLTLLHPMSSSMMIKPVRTFRRTFHVEAFIQNAKLFYQIFSILTFPLSSTVGVGSMVLKTGTVKESK